MLDHLSFLQYIVFPSVIFYKYKEYKNEKIKQGLSCQRAQSKSCIMYYEIFCLSLFEKKSTSICSLLLAVLLLPVRRCQLNAKNACLFGSIAIGGGKLSSAIAYLLLAKQTRVTLERAARLTRPLGPEKAPEERESL